ncbi:MAG: hypothetical protein ACRD7E_28255, partial [Bryobacteraceae bacterium]
MRSNWKLRRIGAKVIEVLYVSEKKLYGRLGIKPRNYHAELGGAIGVPDIAQASGSITWNNENGSLASHEDLVRGIKKIKEFHAPLPFTNSNLRP